MRRSFRNGNVDVKNDKKGRVLKVVDGSGAGWDSNLQGLGTGQVKKAYRIHWNGGVGKGAVTQEDPIRGAQGTSSVDKIKVNICHARTIENPR